MLGEWLECRVETAEKEVCGYRRMLESEACLDQARNPCRSFRVPDDRLDRAYEECLISTFICWKESLADSLSLLGITRWSTRTMCLEELATARLCGWIQPCLCVSGSDKGCLRRGAGHSETRRPAVMIHPDFSNNALDYSIRSQ